MNVIAMNISAYIRSARLFRWKLLSNGVSLLANRRTHGRIGYGFLTVSVLVSVLVFMCQWCGWLRMRTTFTKANLRTKRLIDQKDWPIAICNYRNIRCASLIIQSKISPFRMKTPAEIDKPIDVAFPMADYAISD